MNTYSFDITLVGAISVDASSEDEALRLLEECLQCADTNFGCWPSGRPILGETSLVLDDGCYGPPRLYAITEAAEALLKEKAE